MTLNLEDTLFETRFTEFKKPKAIVRNVQTIHFFSYFENCASWTDCKNMTAINPIGIPKVGQKHSENISQATCSYVKTWEKTAIWLNVQWYHKQLIYLWQLQLHPGKPFIYIVNGMLMSPPQSLALQGRWSTQIPGWCLHMEADPTGWRKQDATHQE